MVKNSDDLYSFLNASYFNGNDVLKYETKHTIGLVQITKDKPEVNEFIKFVSNEGQKRIGNEGLTPIKNIRK